MSRKRIIALNLAFVVVFLIMSRLYVGWLDYARNLRLQEKAIAVSEGMSIVIVSTATLRAEITRTPLSFLKYEVLLIDKLLNFYIVFMLWLTLVNGMLYLKMKKHGVEAHESQS